MTKGAKFLTVLRIANINSKYRPFSIGVVVVVVVVDDKMFVRHKAVQMDIVRRREKVCVYLNKIRSEC